MIDVVGRVGGGAGMLGGVDGEVLGERVQERVPLEAPGAVEEDEGGAAALGEDAHANAVLPDGEHTGLGAVQSGHGLDPPPLPPPQLGGGGSGVFFENDGSVVP